MYKRQIYAGPSAAKALLSRVYLYMGNNKLAAEYATEVIESLSLIHI